MVSAFTPNKRIEQPAFNDYVDSWDVPVNADWGIIDTALGGIYTLNATGLSGNQVLTSSQYQPLKIRVTGLPIGAVNVRVPSGVGGIWLLRNDTTGGFTITMDSAAGGSAVTIAAGQNTLVTCDGTALGMFQAINTPGAAGGSNTQVQFNNAGVLGGSADLTWDGTTLTTNGLATTGNATLGNGSGDTLTLNGTATSAPNGLAVNTNQLYLNSAGNKVAVGTVTPGTSMFTVAGTIESTSGGYVFPDGTVQTSSASSPTGTIVAYAGSTAPAGWILAWGTIGGALSSATNLASSTTEALFTLFWNSWANGQAAVSGGRGASAAADFAASKTIAIVDMRGRVPIARDNMGGTAAGRTTSFGVGPDGNTLGATGGTQIDPAQTVNSGGVNSITTGGTVFGTTFGAPSASALVANGADQNVTLASAVYGVTVTGNFSGNNGINVSGTTTTASNLPPAIITNYIIKL